MGLDTVELVMAFEDAFEIDIPDAVAETMVSVGDVVDYVVAERLRRGETADPLDVFLRVRKITVDRLGADPDRITRSTRFVYDLGAD